MILASLVSFLVAQAPELSPQSTEQTESKQAEQVIVDARTAPSVKVCQPFVESGSDVIVGSPEENLQAAYRVWERKCDQWKNQMKADNKENLMIRSCGSPQLREQTAGVQKFFVYESKTTYKIKVGCPE